MHRLDNYCYIVLMEKGDSNLFRYSFNNGEAGLFKAIAQTEEECFSRGIPKESTFLINLCIEEIVTNTLKYGSFGKNAINIQIIIDFNPHDYMLTISDDANPFNPLKEAPSPDLESSIEERKLGGLGIYLLRNMTRSIEYEFCNNKNKIFIKI